MTENEYSNLSDLVKLRAAEVLLRDAWAMDEKFLKERQEMLKTLRARIEWLEKKIKVR